MDLKSAARSLARQPGSALVAALILALGIGLATFMFSLVYGVLIRGLDVPESDRIAAVARFDRADPNEDGPVLGQDFLDLRERARSFSGLLAYYGGVVSLADEEAPARYQGAYVTANAFDVLRVRPVLGRTFAAGEDAPGLPPTVILGYHVWQDRYAGDRGVIGKSVRINGVQGTIVGVMPEGFKWPSNHDLWIAMNDDARAAAPGTGRSYAVMGRLADGVTWDQGGLEVERIAAQLAAEHPEVTEELSFRLMTVTEQQTGGEIATVFLTMMGAVMCVLLVACANVANLLLARATTRMREAGVRVAIGASRTQVMTPYLAEALVLALAGAAVGTALAYWGVGLFDRATDPALTGRPYFITFVVDLPVLAFALGVTAFTTLASGAAPAFQISRTDVNEILKDEGRGSSSRHAGRIGRALVIVEVAFSVALLVCAGLFTRSMVELGRFEMPFDADPFMTGQVGLFDAEYPTREARQAFWAELERRAPEASGAAGVALAAAVPGVGAGSSRIRLEGQPYAEPSDQPLVHVDQVTPGYFTLLDVALIEGETFDASHTQDVDRVAVVNRSLAEHYWPGSSAVGRRFKTGPSDTLPSLTIIGVVEDMNMEGFDPDLGPGDTSDGYYVPVAQGDPRFLRVVARAARGEPLALVPALRDALRSIDPDVPMYEVRTIAEAAERESWFYRVFGTVFVVFGVVATFMATVGLYGVLSFWVSRRTQEMGIRMALGAERSGIVRLVVRQAATQIGVGLALGLVMAAGLSRLVGFLLFGVTPGDPLVFATVILLTLGVGLAASVVPARRATGVDPMVALRID